MLRFGQLQAADLGFTPGHEVTRRLPCAVSPPGTEILVILNAVGM